MDRRGFLRVLGVGAAAVATLPLDELIDRLDFARSPTTSLYVAKPSPVQQWEDTFFAEYIREADLLRLRDIQYFAGAKWSDEHLRALQG